MLWEITRRTPAKSAASIRLRVPSRRMRLLAAKFCEDRSVSWWKTTSGRAAATTSRNSRSVVHIPDDGPDALRDRLVPAGERGHFVALSNQLGNETAADHAGGAGDEDPHGITVGSSPTTIVVQLVNDFLGHFRRG